MIASWINALGCAIGLAVVGLPQLQGEGTTSGTDHWAFRPVTPPQLPAIQDLQWPSNPVDVFVLAKLEFHGLRPSKPADPRTRLRRVYYTLTGLPPTYAETIAFQRDPSPLAYAAVVDRLLNSPAYGERWARHWLDIARYADTKGYVFQEERRYPYSYTYRDYVVQAFNADKPYDQFLIEQIAADLLPHDEDRSPLAALGFLTLGRRFLNNIHDIIDDRIDVVTRGTMGLTVACARCHDHKSDPIAMEDYYALHGVFHSSGEPEEKPLLGPLRETSDYRDFLQKKADLESQENAEIQKAMRDFLGKQRARLGDYLHATVMARSLGKDETLETLAGKLKLTAALVQRWSEFLKTSQASTNRALVPWFALSSAPSTSFGLWSANLLTQERPTNWNVYVVQALVRTNLNSLGDVAAVYNQLGAQVDAEWTRMLQASASSPTAGTPVALSSPDEEELRLLLYGSSSPLRLSEAQVDELIGRQIRNETVKYRHQIEALQWQHPGAPPRAMALQDNSQPSNSRIFRRGNPANPGEEVPRRFLSVLAGAQTPPFSHGSGRLELAQAIATNRNPLTARVWVNRVWSWHFGKPLVSTPSDFGLHTEAPPQRDLLDWLASTFMTNGWSTKRLNRLLVLSQTFQQSSEHSSDSDTRDPDNVLWHRAMRTRLDFEALRDTWLSVAGTLEPKMGGLPVDLFQEPFTGRRTLYGLIDRQNLPGTFRNFDLPNPDVTSPGRFVTTVPQQALFTMNSPFLMFQARKLIERTEFTVAANDRERIRLLYEIILQRPPEPEELVLGENFIANARGATEPKAEHSPGPWPDYAQVLLQSNELAFLD